MSQPSSKRHALTFVLITVLLDVIGFGIVMPVMPRLLQEITGLGLSETSSIAGYLLVSYAVLQFVFAPVLGNLSDRFGRRPVLLASLCAYGVNYLIMGFAATLWVLFIGRIFTGIASATHATASAVIADVTEPEERAQNFGMLGMAFGVGFIIGPALGGLLGDWDVRAPFFAAAVLALANTLYGFFVMKETLSPEHRRPFSWARANPVGAFMQLRHFPMLGGLVGVMFIYNIGHHVYPANWNFFTMARFDWSGTEIGLSMGFVGLMMAIVQGGLIRLVIPKLGAPRTAFVGFTAAAASFLGLAFAGSEAVLYSWLVVSALAGFVMPAVQSIVTNHVPQNQQGEMQGIMASINSVGAIVGPLALTQTFAYFTAPGAPIYFPGAALFLAGSLSLIALALFALNVRGLIQAEVLSGSPSA